MSGIYYDHHVVIDSRDADGQGHCRPSALLGHLQEAATLAAEDAGFGRAKMVEETGAFWMLARMWFELKRPLQWPEELTVRTWHRGGKAALMYRDFDLYAGDEPVGQAVSAWVLADLNTHRLLRLGDVHALDGTDGGELCKTRTLSKLRLPKEMALAETRKLHYSDTDINGHVNNTRYADFACDALEMHRREPGVFLSSMQLGYTAECRPGETISLLTGRDGEAFCVKGVDAAGKARFEAELIFGKVCP